MAKTDTTRRAQVTTDEAPTWPLNVAIVLALCVAFAGLNAILVEPSWWFVAAGVTVAVTFAIGTVRSLTRWAGWGSVAGLAALIVSLTFAFASREALIGVVPTLDSLNRFTELLADGATSISSQGVPAEATPGIVFMLAGGAGVLAIACDYVAVVARMPALVGVPLGAILAIPTIFDPSAVDPFVFVLTAAAFLLLLYLGIGEARTGGALGVAASALAIALILPVIAPTAAPPDPERPGGSGFSIGINTFISLGDNLRRPSPSTVLEYTTTARDGQYLTVSSIDNFTGSQWRPAEPGTRWDSGGLLAIGPVPGLSEGVQVAEETTAIDLVNMGGRFAPAPYAPARIIGLGDDWGFDPENLTITSTGDSARGSEYEVVSTLPNPTVQQLRAAGPVPAGLERYLEIPERLPAIVAETAIAVVAEEGAETAFDQALALQAYFTGGEFRYSEDAPVEQGYDGTSADVVGEFLEAKSGYCVHFSSAMAVMARTLGIPARISVGFTPGEYQAPEGDDEEPYYLVTTANLHAWPELYFTDIGWVRFEPTVSVGVQPDFASETDPTAAPSSAPSASASSAPTPSASAGSASPSPSAAATDAGGELTGLVVAGVTVGLLGLAAVVVLLLPLVPAIVRAVRRSRRYWRIGREQSAGDAWAELSDTAIDLGWKAEATTPREFEHLVRPGMAASATAALERLRSAIERTAYSREPEVALIADVRVVRRAMLRASTRNDRMRARFSPRSVVLRGWRRR